MGFLAAAIPAISAIGSIVGTGASIYQSLKKPKTAALPKMAPLSTGDQGPKSNVRQSLISTSPQGLLDSGTSTTRQTLLGG
jgi:hypothetical protein